MYIGANELALLSRIAQTLIFLILAALTIRDLRRGENGTTPGLLILSIGMLITNALALFITITSHHLSPGGFIPLSWDDATYDLIFDTWHAAGGWTVAAGAWMLGIYIYRAGRK